jgi:hypothetical protein
MGVAGTSGETISPSTGIRPAETAIRALPQRSRSWAQAPLQAVTVGPVILRSPQTARKRRWASACPEKKRVIEEGTLLFLSCGRCGAGDKVRSDTRDRPFRFAQIVPRTFFPPAAVAKPQQPLILGTGGGIPGSIEGPKALLPGCEAPGPVLTLVGSTKPFTTTSRRQAKTDVLAARRLPSSTGKPPACRPCARPKACREHRI